MALLAMTGAATAAELPPGNGYSIHLDRFTGAAYYTVEQAGYRVVATLAEGEDGLPVRFVSTLAEGQALTISIPGSLGEPARLLAFKRLGNRLVVSPDSSSDYRMSVSRQVADE
jgi:hypothetical protein